MVLMLLTPLDVMPDFDYFIVFFAFSEGWEVCFN